MTRDNEIGILDGGPEYPVCPRLSPFSWQVLIESSILRHRGPLHPPCVDSSAPERSSPHRVCTTRSLSFGNPRSQVFLSKHRPHNGLQRVNAEIITIKAAESIQQKSPT